MPNDVWRFLRDPNEQKRFANSLMDVANRGLVAGTFGAPVDMATQAANLLVAGGGYAGHKLGLLSQPPDLIDPASVPGSSEWIGNKMQRAGLLGDYRNPIAELGAGLLSPVAAKGAMKAGTSIYQGNVNAAMATKAGPISKQRGAYIVAPNKIDPKHLEQVKKEMQELGPPVIRAYYDGEKYIALEGSHRLRAAKDLGITPEIQEVSLRQWFQNHDFQDVKDKASTNRVLDYLDWGQSRQSPYYDFEDL
jgi:hypothetical protein